MMDKALIELHNAKRYKNQNKRVKNMLSYHISLREWETVLHILKNINRFTGDQNLVNQYSKLFLTDPRAKEFFGLGEDIVGSMANMVFGGNVKVVIEQENIQKQINTLYDDGYFVQSVINAYKAAASTSGRSYLFFDTTVIYDTHTDIKIKDEFLKFTVVPEFELDIKDNLVIRKFYKTHQFGNEDKIIEFRYNYNILENNYCNLVIEGFFDDNIQLTPNDVINILNIISVEEEFDFIPFNILDIGEGMLPNIVHIENSLAENLYFQDEDLPNSQTNVYIPETQLYDAHIGDGGTNRDSVYDKYNLKKVVKGSIDKGGDLIKPIEGKSAIMTIERNLALNVIQGVLDAKINPISIGYLLTDKMGNNTDVGADKERASIRLREKHIDSLKIFIAKVVKKYLMLFGFKVKLEKIGVLFAPYITPSIESLTNILAKQVQYGLISHEQAVRKLNSDELSDEEIDKEVEKIMIMVNKQDFNTEQNLGKTSKKGIDNNLKSDGIEE